MVGSSSEYFWLRQAGLRLQKRLISLGKGAGKHHRREGHLDQLAEPAAAVTWPPDVQREIHGWMIETRIHDFCLTSISI